MNYFLVALLVVLVVISIYAMQTKGTVDMPIPFIKAVPVYNEEQEEQEEQEIIAVPVNNVPQVVQSSCTGGPDEESVDDEMRRLADESGYGQKPVYFYPNGASAPTGRIQSAGQFHPVMNCNKFECEGCASCSPFLGGSENPEYPLYQMS